MNFWYVDLVLSFRIFGEDPFHQVIGILRVIGEVLQSSTNQQCHHHLGEIVSLIEAIRDDREYTSNTVVRKWLSKLTGRVTTIALPPTRGSRIRNRG